MRGSRSSPTTRPRCVAPRCRRGGGRAVPSALRRAGGRGGLLLVAVPATAAAVLLFHLLVLLQLLRRQDRLDLLVHLLAPRPHRLPVRLRLVRLPLLVRVAEELRDLASLVVAEAEPLLHPLDTVLDTVALRRALGGDGDGPDGRDG